MTRKFCLSSGSFCLFVGAAALLVACGGSQAPAESPEASPAAESGSTDTPGDGEHTMPDGTKMEGDTHGEHTMPDGTKMEGHEHGAGDTESGGEQK
jgi:hypothetical protein